MITAIHQPPQRVTIRLTRPNACSLPYDDLGLTLRYAARLRNRADAPSRRGDACGMTPRAALLDHVARVGARDGAAVRFIGCDKRSDINWVALTVDRTQQPWGAIAGDSQGPRVGVRLRVSSGPAKAGP